MKPKRKSWTEPEIVVLCAIFSLSNFSMGDDEKDECKKIAAEFARTPATIDRQWRNIKDYHAGNPTKKVGRLVKYWAQIVLDNPKPVRELALYYCQTNNWILENLLEDTRTKFN